MDAALNGPQGCISLGPTPLSLGRAQDNAIVVADGQASSHHAEIGPGLGGTNYVLTDLGSTNGTFVNEQRLTPRVARPLRSGDVIRIGGTSFSFEVAGSAEATVRASFPSPDLDATVIGPPSPSYDVPPTAYGVPQSYGMPPQPEYTPQTAGNVPQSGYSPQVGYPQQPDYSQQGWYQQQSGYQQPPQFPDYSQPPKKSRLGLWIALAVVVVIVLGVVGFGIVYANRSTPQKTLDVACTAFKNDDAQGLFDQLSSRAQAKTSVTQVKQTLSFLELATQGIKACTYIDLRQSGSMATATMVLTANKTGSKPLDLDTKLVNENGTWKIDEDVNSQSA